MPLAFPASPTNGQVYNQYIYSTAIGAWKNQNDPTEVATLITGKANLSGASFSGPISTTGSITAIQPLIYGKITSGFAGNGFITVTSIYNTGGFSSLTAQQNITVPMAGKYQIDTQQLISPSGAAYWRLYINGANYLHAYTTGTMQDLHIHTIINLQQYDTISFYYGGSTPSSWSDEHSRFSVAKIA
jgi:hypothetical protein